MTDKPNETRSTRRLRPLLSGVVLRSQTDARLAALAREGNQPAFTAIVERYQRELRAHAARIVRPDRAEDVVQQAVLSAWTALLAGADVSDLRPWLHRIVHNAALSTLTRRGYNDSEIPATSIAPHLTDDLAEGRLSAAEALTAIAALPEAQRRALTLTAIDGHSGRDAALAMGISESAMRQLVYRARSGVRSAVTAVIPLPLITWLTSTGGAVTATSGAIGLGATGGVTAAATKVIAVLAVAGAALGTGHALTTRHPASHPHPTATTPIDPSGTQAAPANPLTPEQSTLTSQQLQRSVEAANAENHGGTQRINGGQGNESVTDTGNAAGQPAGSSQASRTADNTTSGQQPGLIAGAAAAGQAGESLVDAESATSQPAGTSQASSATDNTTSEQQSEPPSGANTPGQPGSSGIGQQP
ncbi:MAG: sigma-70 family RNA polymerase sigma factor [Solirubrobacteraceae bacterium]